jgi:hypothetical protein
VSIDSREAVGGCGTGGEDGRSWLEISTILYIVLVILDTDSLFECDFVNGQCIHDVSDTQRAGMMAFPQAIRKRLKNA